MTKLLKLLRAARRKLDEYFPSTKTKYFVRRHFDNNGLVLKIHTDLDSETALKQLDNFKDDWWLDNMPTEGYSLLIDVMFA